MATVIANMSMSLDGFVAQPDDDPGPIFDWYDAGDVEVPTADHHVFHTDGASATQLREMFEEVGAIVCGRRLFDLTRGWNGNHPAGADVFVVTHRAPDGWASEVGSTTFVTDGVERAITLAQQEAGDRVVAVASPTIAQQCLDLGLLDRIRVDLAPVVLGHGIPFFANLHTAPVVLEDATVTQGRRVTHLDYVVRSLVPAAGAEVDA